MEWWWKVIIFLLFVAGLFVLFCGGAVYMFIRALIKVGGEDYPEVEGDGEEYKLVPTSDFNRIE